MGLLFGAKPTLKPLNVFTIFRKATHISGTGKNKKETGNMTGLVIFLFAVLVACALAVMAASHDWRGLKIPNIFAVGIIATFALAFTSTSIMNDKSTYFYGISSHISAFALVFGITFLFYTLRLLGAGDSKLATAMALWLGLPGLPAFLLYTTCAGGLLALGALMLRHAPALPTQMDAPWINGLRTGQNKLPYGLALAAGFIGALVYRGAFSPQVMYSFIS